MGRRVLAVVGPRAPLPPFPAPTPLARKERVGGDGSGRAYVPSSHRLSSWVSAFPSAQWADDCHLSGLSRALRVVTYGDKPCKNWEASWSGHSPPPRKRSLFGDRSSCLADYHHQSHICLGRYNWGHTGGQAGTCFRSLHKFSLRAKAEEASVKMATLAFLKQ